VSQLGAGVVGQQAEYDQKENKVIWRIKKFQGGTEQTLRTKVAHSSDAGHLMMHYRSHSAKPAQTASARRLVPSGLFGVQLTRRPHLTRHVLLQHGLRDPMYNPSGLQVRYLRILENKSYNPYRWVRYVTRSSSYICRL